MPAIKVTVNGVPIAVETEDDLVIVLRALRRLDQSQPSKPTPVPKQPHKKKAAREENTTLHAVNFSKVHRFFEALKGARTGITPEPLVKQLGLPGTRSLAAYVGVVRQSLKGLDLEYDDLVHAARPTRANLNGRRVNVYSLTDQGRRQVEDVIRSASSKGG
jgi:hypothetical protein